MKFICRKNGSQAGHFTDGKVYESRTKTGNLFNIIDDLGHARAIIPDVPCPHLMFSRGYSQYPVGIFETVKEK